MGGMDFSHMMNGFNNMDMNQMMQMMAANGMGGFNPMMGEFIRKQPSRTYSDNNRIAYGCEFNVKRHVWRFWGFKWWHDWNECYEHGNEFRSKSRHALE
jgi:hypothetical protein